MMYAARNNTLNEHTNGTRDTVYPVTNPLREKLLCYSHKQHLVNLTGFTAGKNKGEYLDSFKMSRDSTRSTYQD